MNDQLEVQYAPPSVLRRHPRNPRRGDVEAIKRSISLHGFINPLLVQESTGIVIAGNHRLDAAVELGLVSVPVVYLEVDDDKALEIMLMDNRTSDLASYDDRALADLLREVEDSIGLEGTGFDPDTLENLLAGLGDMTVEGIVDEVESTLAPPRDMQPQKGTVQARGMREVVLVMPVETWTAFSEQVRFLQRCFSAPSTSETVARAVAHAAADYDMPAPDGS